MIITISPAEYKSLYNKMPMLDLTAELLFDDEQGNTETRAVPLRDEVLGSALCMPANDSISGRWPDGSECYEGWESYCERTGIEPGVQDKYGEYEITPELKPHWDTFWEEMYVEGAEHLSDWLTEAWAQR